MKYLTYVIAVLLGLSQEADVQQIVSDKTHTTEIVLVDSLENTPPITPLSTHDAIIVPFEGQVEEVASLAKNIDPPKAHDHTVHELPQIQSIPLTEYREMAWDEKKLAWSDFEMHPEANSDFAAITSTYIEELHGCNPEGDFKFDVKAVFVKNLSWTRTNNSSKLLKHEQVHFDITEYHARLMRQFFASLSDPCGDDFLIIEFNVDRIFDNMAEMQQKYDFQTHHGLNKDDQSNWEDFIADRLEELKMFDSKSIVPRGTFNSSGETKPFLQ